MTNYLGPHSNQQRWFFLFPHKLQQRNNSISALLFVLGMWDERATQASVFVLSNGLNRHLSKCTFSHEIMLNFAISQKPYFETRKKQAFSYLNINNVLSHHWRSRSISSIWSSAPFTCKLFLIATMYRLELLTAFERFLVNCPSSKASCKRKRCLPTANLRNASPSTSSLSREKDSWQFSVVSASRTWSGFRQSIVN